MIFLIDRHSGEEEDEESTCCNGSNDDNCGIKTRNRRFRTRSEDDQFSIKKINIKDKTIQPIRDKEEISWDSNFSYSVEETDMLPDACSHQALCIVLIDGTKRYLDFCASTFFATKNIDDKEFGAKEHGLFSQAQSRIPILYTRSEEELKECGFIRKQHSKMRKIMSKKQYLDIITEKYPNDMELFIIMLSNLLRGFVGNFPDKISKKEMKYLGVKPIHTAIWTHLQELKRKKKEKSNNNV